MSGGWTRPGAGSEERRGARGGTIECRAWRGNTIRDTSESRTETEDQTGGTAGLKHETSISVIMNIS